MSTIRIKAKAAVWQWVYSQIFDFELPQKLGGKDYPAGQRRLVKEWSAKLEAVFAGASHFPNEFGRDWGILFGDKDDWEEEKAESRRGGRSWQHKGKNKEYALEFSREETNAMAWLFIVLLSPSEYVEKEKGEQIMTHQGINNTHANLFVWPIAKAIRKVDAIRKELGLDDREIVNKCEFPDDASAKSSDAKESAIDAKSEVAI